MLNFCKKRHLAIRRSAHFSRILSGSNYGVFFAFAAGLFAGLALVAGVLAGLAPFVEFVALVAGVFAGAGVEAGVETTTGVEAFAGLFAALLEVVVSPPHAIPKALNAKNVESAMIFFMSFIVLLSFLKE